MNQQEWYTPKELAGLPGMPGTHSAVIRRAKREGWNHRQRSGRGGGREYAFSDLPLETQAELLKRAAPEAPAKPTRKTSTANQVVDREGLWQAYDAKPQRTKDEAARRLQALQAVERLINDGHGKSRAVEQIAQAFGESRATVYRWQQSVKGLSRPDWLAALVPHYTGRTATAECTPEAWEYFKAQYLRAEAPSIAACYKWTREAAKSNGWQWPAKRTVIRWVQDIPITTRILTREGEERLMQHYPSQKRTVRNLHALQWINGDGYKHNVFVKMNPDDPEEKPWRPKTWFWQDVRSRRIIGFRTDRTEHTDMIRLSLGDVLERFGIPEHVTIDNTRAAANKWMTGGVANRYRFKVKEEDPIGLMPQLGIQVHWTSVFNGKGHGQAKPVERAFGVGGLGEYVDKRYEFRGAYTGTNPMAKPENYASTAVAFDEFCRVLSDAIRLWNEEEGRNTEICNGRLSFAQAFDESYERSQAVIRRPTTAQLLMWLMAAESVRVQRDSTVSLRVGAGPNGLNRYGGDTLINHIGKRVVIRFDPDNLHQEVHAYQLDGRYIGEVPCQEAAGFGDSSTARESARSRKQITKAAKAQAAAQKRMTELEVMDRMGAPQPEEDAPAQTKVTRGNFEAPKRVVGSDVTPELDDEAEHNTQQKYSWDSVVEAEFEKWKKHQI